MLDAKKLEKRLSVTKSGAKIGGAGHIVLMLPRKMVVIQLSGVKLSGGSQVLGRPSRKRWKNGWSVALGVGATMQKWTKNFERGKNKWISPSCRKSVGAGHLALVLPHKNSREMVKWGKISRCGPTVKKAFECAWCWFYNAKMAEKRFSRRKMSECSPTVEKALERWKNKRIWQSSEKSVRAGRLVSVLPQKKLF